MVLYLYNSCIVSCNIKRGQNNEYKHTVKLNANCPSTQSWHTKHVWPLQAPVHMQTHVCGHRGEPLTTIGLSFIQFTPSEVGHIGSILT